MADGRRGAGLLLGVLGVLGGATGCYRAQLEPVAPVPIRLVSPAGFVLHAGSGPGAAVASCEAVRAEADLAAVRGDTLVLSRVRTVAQAANATPCAMDAPAFVVLSAHPELRREHVRFSDGRTWGAILLGVPVVLTAIAVLAWIIDPGVT